MSINVEPRYITSDSREWKDQGQAEAHEAVLQNLAAITRFATLQSDKKNAVTRIVNNLIDWERFKVDPDGYEAARRARLAEVAEATEAGEKVPKQESEQEAA